MRYTIGRDINSDISINADSVSFHHLYIEQEGERWYIIDNNSTNGTYLNSLNNQITKVELRAGDTLYLATYKLSSDKIINMIESSDVGDENFDKDEILIGRDPDADTTIDNPNISWHHAKILKEGDSYYIYDLGSTNGSFVNNQMVQDKQRIVEGDTVTLGIYSFVFQSSGGIKLASNDRDGIRLDSKNISFSVMVNDEEFGKTKKILLDNISFTIYPGELVGIMGLSGAGKTTLLNILNGDSNPTDGEIFINGRSLSKNYKSIKNFIGYVPQDDIIHPELTVYEALFYSSKLRLSSDLSDDEVNRRIDTVLKELGIYETKDVLIGSAQTTKGISGGQRKRVNIAMELLASPEIIFLDEPTSGLSSVDTQVVMEKLKELSDNGKTVILTIHQPSLSNYKKMDSMIILTRGELAYFGSNYPESIEFFNQESIDDDILSEPDNALLGLDRGEKEGKKWSRVYRSSPIYKRFVEDRAHSEYSEDGVEGFEKDSSNSFISQFKILTTRYLNIKLKDKINTAVLLIQAPVIAVLLIFLFSSDGYKQYQENPAILLFILIISSVWFGVINSVREIVSEKAIYKREQLFGVKAFPYVLSKFTILTILSFIQVSLLVIMVDGFVPLEINLLNLIALIFLISLSGLGIGLLLSATSKSSAQALALVPVILLPMIIFAGGMIPIKDMPTNRTYIDAYRVSMLMPTRWALEEVLREYDNYKSKDITKLREPIRLDCNSDYNETKYPSSICDYDYNALYLNENVYYCESGCEGKRCIESKYINLIKDVWRNTKSSIIYLILSLYIILPLLFTVVILKRRNKK